MKNIKKAAALLLLVSFVFSLVSCALGMSTFIPFTCQYFLIAFSTTYGSRQNGQMAASLSVSVFIALSQYGQIACTNPMSFPPSHANHFKSLFNSFTYLLVAFSRLFSCFFSVLSTCPSSFRASLPHASRKFLQLVICVVISILM